MIRMKTRNYLGIFTDYYRFFHAVISTEPNRFMIYAYLNKPFSAFYLSHADHTGFITSAQRGISRVGLSVNQP